MTVNPADAVREALELVGVVVREYGHMKAVDAMNTVEDAFDALAARVAEQAAEIVRLEQMAESRLRAIEALKPAALAGAAPVAWDFPICDEPRYPGDPMRAAIYDAEEAERLKAKGYDVRGLFTHAPAKAREVTDRDVERACIAWAGTYEYWGRLTEPTRAATRADIRAALATFAEREK